MGYACVPFLPHVATLNESFYHGMPPHHSKTQLASSHCWSLVLSSNWFGECGALVHEMRRPVHMVGSWGKKQLRCSYHVELVQINVHGLGCDVFASFSRGLTCGLVQAVERLKHVVQALEVMWWLVQSYPLSIEVPGDQAYCICSKAWEDFHRQCLAKKCQFSHV